MSQHPAGWYTDATSPHYASYWDGETLSAGVTSIYDLDENSPIKGSVKDLGLNDSDDSDVSQYEKNENYVDDVLGQHLASAPVDEPQQFDADDEDDDDDEAPAIILNPDEPVKQSLFDAAPSWKRPRTGRSEAIVETAPEQEQEASSGSEPTEPGREVDPFVSGLPQYDPEPTDREEVDAVSDEEWEREESARNQVQEAVVPVTVPYFEDSFEDDEVQNAGLTDLDVEGDDAAQVTAAASPVQEEEVFFFDESSPAETNAPESYETEVLSQAVVEPTPVPVTVALPAVVDQFVAAVPTFAYDAPPMTRRERREREERERLLSLQAREEESHQEPVNVAQPEESVPNQVEADEDDDIAVSGFPEPEVVDTTDAAYDHVELRPMVPLETEDQEVPAEEEYGDWKVLEEDDSNQDDTAPATDDAVETHPEPDSEPDVDEDVPTDQDRTDPPAEPTGFRFASKFGGAHQWGSAKSKESDPIAEHAEGDLSPTSVDGYDLTYEDRQLKSGLFASKEERQDAKQEKDAVARLNEILERIEKALELESTLIQNIKKLDSALETKSRESSLVNS